MSEISYRSIPLFSGLNDEQLDLLKSITNKRRYKAGEILFFEGDKPDAFYIVVEGEIQIIKVSYDGKEKILEVMGPGDFFGEMAIIDSKGRSATARVIRDSSLLVVGNQEFLNLVREYPFIALKIIGELSRRLRQANQDIESLAFLDVETRLKKFFRRMTGEIRDNGEAVVIDRNITHQDIARFIGTSRETVTRIINKLKDKGLLEIKREKIILKDINKW
ncbi:Crp/Fnr family transcriptional regulator [Halothermothrix orenii]|uniref:Putative transcriptional regulator, Crp/Fnr family n=1 Tax=Halothermothrix orenii (strain H 168 / OCM 544 / DSM 9562) TaxID=373903 RepID=B8CZ46_HALOH|nr:Crp/Fnr family transcriptional regulator [Halothermothrix orenii]ACL70565.1 putative transcriptional regulator, Crp/Fnr family [Halothermothrix orenii H 168]